LTIPRKCDYATFLSTVVSLGREENITIPGRTSSTLRAEFGLDDARVRAAAVRQPIEQLANGVGVLLLAVTEDDKVILSRRRLGVGARAGELDVSVIEGVHNILDQTSPGRLDVHATAQRGCLVR
jgi:hypothetical protein